MRNCEDRSTHDLLATSSWVEQPTKGHVRSTCWNLKSFSAWWHLTSDLTQLARCTASYFVCLSSFLYPHYKKLHYPQNCKENFREKTLEIHLRVRDYTPTILYTFLLVFFYLYLSNFISIERFLAQTYTSPILSVMSCFGAFRKYRVMPFYGGCN